jgi:hypothetical protein
VISVEAAATDLDSYLQTSRMGHIQRIGTVNSVIFQECSSCGEITICHSMPEQRHQRPEDPKR